MDIDDIKASWKTATGDAHPKHVPVADIMQSTSRGPLTSIRKRLRRQVILLVISVALIFKTTVHKDIFHDVFFWCYLVAITGIIGFFLYNYREAGKIVNHPEKQIAEHLRNFVSGLEKRLRLYRTGIRVVLLFFILLSETLPYFANEPMLEKWHVLHPAIRILLYVALLVVHYFLGRFLYQRRYGQYLSRLHEVLEDLK